MIETIDKLTAFLPHFEAGDKPSYSNWFMDFHRVAMDKFCDDNYPQNIKWMGWDKLTDIEYISKTRVDQLKTILTTIIRSERNNTPETYWSEYIDAGSFTAILKRLAAIREQSRQRIGRLLPHFVKKEKARYSDDNFMNQLEGFLTEYSLYAQLYPSRLDDLGGWDMLNDIKFAETCSLGDCSVLLTAAIRSERTSMEEGAVWQKYIDNGLFAVLLQRLIETGQEV